MKWYSFRYIFYYHSSVFQYFNWSSRYTLFLFIFLDVDLWISKVYVGSGVGKLLREKSVGFLYHIAEPACKFLHTMNVWGWPRCMQMFFFITSHVWTRMYILTSLTQIKVYGFYARNSNCLFCLIDPWIYITSIKFQELEKIRILKSTFNVLRILSPLSLLLYCQTLLCVMQNKKQTWSGLVSQYFSTIMTNSYDYGRK